MIHSPRLVPDLLDLAEAQFAMDATPDRCALLDATGCITRANLPWETSTRQHDPVALSDAGIGTDYLSATGRAALNGNREAGALHAQIRAILDGDSDRARLEFDRPLRSGGTTRCVATVERVMDGTSACVLIAFTASTTYDARPTSVPEAGFSVPRGARYERLVTALDSLPSHAAILDTRGRIASVNAAWQMFTAAAGGDIGRTGVGVSYLGVCERAAASGDARAADFGRGLGSVLRGERHTYTSDSRVGLGGATRSFRGRVTGLSLAEGRFVLITHTEIGEAAPARPTTRHAAA